MKTYTIGEIYKQGLLKNWKGESYKDKASVSKVVNRMKFKIKKTPFGEAKTITEKQIEDYNRQNYKI